MVENGCINTDSFLVNSDEFSLATTETKQDTFVWSGVQLLYAGKQKVTFSCKVNGCKSYGTGEHCTPADRCKNNYGLSNRKMTIRNNDVAGDDVVGKLKRVILFII